MKNNYDIIIIGAGASGLMCGSVLAKKGFSILLIEKNNKIGKKLAATGNGRCNFTNKKLDKNDYYGDRDFIDEIIKKISPEDVINTFEKMGIYHRDKEGYVYPYTNQAITVIDALKKANTDIDIMLDTKATDIKKSKNGFVIETANDRYESKYLVLATGGASYEELGGSTTGYELVKKMGHTVKKVYPALTGLESKEKYFEKVAGTRIQGAFSLKVGKKEFFSEVGEIQIVKKGISGIPVFQVSRLAAIGLDEGKEVKGIIDFVPTMSEADVKDWIDSHGIEGLVQNKWIEVLKNKSDISNQLKHFEVPVCDTFGMKKAQVCAGGVPTKEVDCSFESKIHQGLFLLGEMLDVDGKCGGYNLHFAWASAILAANKIIELRNGE